MEIHASESIPAFQVVESSQSKDSAQGTAPVPTTVGFATARGSKIPPSSDTALKRARDLFSFETRDEEGEETEPPKKVQDLGVSGGEKPEVPSQAAVLRAHRILASEESTPGPHSIPPNPGSPSKEALKRAKLLMPTGDSMQDDVAALEALAAASGDTDADSAGPPATGAPVVSEALSPSAVADLVHGIDFGEFDVDFPASQPQPPQPPVIFLPSPTLFPISNSRSTGAGHSDCRDDRRQVGLKVPIPGTRRPIGSSADEIRKEPARAHCTPEAPGHPSQLRQGKSEFATHRKTTSRESWSGINHFQTAGSLSDI